MAAGGSAWRRAQEARQRERMLRELAWAAKVEAERWEAGDEGERRVAERLLVLTGQGWRLLKDRRWPGTRSANVDMLLVGPGGVFVIDVKNWRSAPVAEAGRLSAGGHPRDEHVARLLAMTGTVERAVAGLGISPVAVRPLMVFAGQQRVRGAVGRVWLLGESEVAAALLREPIRLRAGEVREVGARLERAFPAYEGAAVARVPPPRRDAPREEPDGLFDVGDTVDAALDAALREPIERWMTFLHPDQLGLVRRRWNGPARISGPAGTGKTVVGLHRAAYLAQRTTKRVLYVTFANNLPRVQSSLLKIMSPSVAERMDFRSLHSWAVEFLRERDVPVRLHYQKAKTAFSHAWRKVGRPSRLSEFNPVADYWQQEIDLVIKGRGVRTFPEYVAVPRRRRATLRREHRELAWALYEEYERIRLASGVHDFNDVLSLALTEVARDPGGSAYGAVVVDEVQDLTLIGVRLMHALVRDVPDGLLLIGDGQQAVYPGGFRLSEAGIDIRGDRGQVLRTNYRNAREILNTALAVVAEDAFEDIDGTRLAGLRDVEPAYADGRVVRAASPTLAGHDRLLVEALLGDQDWAATAVLCPTQREIGHYRRVLTDAGIPVRLLERYDGHPVEAVKLGSYVRAKGLEFKHVYLPQHDASLNGGGVEGEGEVARVQRELARSRLFVAMTRARDTLWLGAVRPA